MYYYIMEQPKGMTARQLQKKIRNDLGFFGIEGEIGLISPARSVEEHVQIAFSKNYSTIVAVGSDKLINKVCSLMQGTNHVLGIIPINTSPQINKIIGLEKIEESFQALKFRKIKLVDLALIEPHKYFLSYATIHSDLPVDLELSIDEYASKVVATDAQILSPSLSDNHNINLYLSNFHDGPGLLSKAYNWLVGRKSKNIYPSVLRGKKILLNTIDPIPVMIDNEIVAKTPIVIKLKPKALKIITSRAKILKDLK